MVNNRSMYAASVPGEYNTHVKVVLNICAFVVLTVSAISLLAFRRTRNTPMTAKYLSSALIIFDFCTTFCFAIRKFILDQRFNIIVNFVGIGWSFLAYVNVAIMSLERLVIFQWPNFYLRYVSYSVTKRVSMTIWVLFILCYLGQFVNCLHQPDYQRILCLAFLAIDYIKITFPVVALISIACFAVILAIIRKQTERSFQKNSGILRHSKPTLAVFVCVLSFIITTSVYICLSLLDIDVNIRRHIFDALAMINQFVDTCVYVVWYTETRLELMKMFSFLHPNMSTKVEQMRIKIFRIVTYDGSDINVSFSNLKNLNGKKRSPVKYYSHGELEMNRVIRPTEGHSHGELEINSVTSPTEGHSHGEPEMNSVTSPTEGHSHSEPEMNSVTSATESHSHGEPEMNSVTCPT